MSNLSKQSKNNTSFDECANSFKNGARIATTFVFLALGSGGWTQFRDSNKNEFYAILGAGGVYLAVTYRIGAYYDGKIKGLEDYRAERDEIYREAKEASGNVTFLFSYDIYSDDEVERLGFLNAEIERLEKLEQEKIYKLKFFVYLYQLLSFFDFVCLICQWAGKSLYEIINSNSGLLIGASIAVAGVALALARYIAKDISIFKGDLGNNNWEKVRELLYRPLKNGRHFASFMGEIAANTYQAVIGYQYLCIAGIALLAVDWSWKYAKDKKHKKRALALGTISGIAHGLYLYQFYWIIASVAFNTSLSFATGGVWAGLLIASCVLWALYYVKRNIDETKKAINSSNEEPGITGGQDASLIEEDSEADGQPGSDSIREGDQSGSDSEEESESSPLLGGSSAQEEPGRGGDGETSSLLLSLSSDNDGSSAQEGPGGDGAGEDGSPSFLTCFTCLFQGRRSPQRVGSMQEHGGHARLANNI